MLPEQGQQIVTTGTLPSYEFVTIQFGVEVVHKITVTGPINLKQRLPLYDATLAVNPSSTFFCILDNSSGYENNLSFADIQVLDQRLVDAGIDCFYGATITADVAYPGIVELASANMFVENIRGEVLATSDRDTADRFIAEKLRLVVRATGGGNS